ncbi:hypothetical protein FQN52_009520 [Onygenales sp. PD_12]|nr:hypothetical protein FQN53_000196 [Emmonsiellopsis sp. PD_33]KAK2783593.1 hypothetical protein FQN52_009520 [Onygenales sp. PD_12]
MIRLGLVAALLSLGGADALSEMLLPRETVGIMADIVGMSPRPTTPPGVPAGVPNELARRQQSRTAIDYPAPGYYCGLVNSDVNNVLSCVDAEAKCVYYRTAVGCCFSSDIQSCTDVATTCYNGEDQCDEACSSDTAAMHCTDTTRPYCGTYFFGEGTRLYGCRSTKSVSSQVQPLSAYFSSRYGSDYYTMSISSSDSVTISEGTATDLPRVTVTATPPSTTSTGPDPNETDEPGDDGDDSSGGSGKGKGKKVSGGAIGGIVVGAVAGIALIAALIFWFLRKKNAKPTDTPQPPAQPMQDPQAGYGAPPGVVGAGYYAPEQKAPIMPSAPPYSPGYPPHIPTSPPSAPSEIAGTPIQNPLLAQSQPLLSANSEYYNQNRASSISQPGSPNPSEMAAGPIGSVSPGSPHGLSATHTGPVPDNIYEMPAAGTGRS